MSRRAWKATRQNALGQWKSSLFQMVWSYLLFPSPNCLLWSKTKTQSLTFSQYLSNFKGYWKDAVISLYACGSQEHGRMSKCQIVLRSSWSKIEILTRKYFVAFSFRKREVLFFEELSFKSFLFNWRKLFCCSWDFSWVLDHFNTENPWAGCSLHPQSLEMVLFVPLPFQMLHFQAGPFTGLFQISVPFRPIMQSGQWRITCSGWSLAWDIRESQKERKQPLGINNRRLKGNIFFLKER